MSRMLSETQFSDNGYSTYTSQEYENIIQLLNKSLADQKGISSDLKKEIKKKPFHSDLLFKRSLHLQFVRKNIISSTDAHMYLASSRPWVLFWGFRTIENLEGFLTEEMEWYEKMTIRTLQNCQHINGGYGGGSYQVPHLLNTYAAIGSLATLGTQKCLSSIDKEGVCHFVLSLQQPSGDFTVHLGGESDVRASYCAIAILSMIHGTHLLEKQYPGKRESRRTLLIRYLISLQTYEGGFAGEPMGEAHAAYTYCAVATIGMLIDTCVPCHKEDIEIPKEEDKAWYYTPLIQLDYGNLITWLSNRQSWGGGFSGRTNKLIDSCYTFWVLGSLFITIDLCRKMGSLVNESLVNEFTTPSLKLISPLISNIENDIHGDMSGGISTEKEIQLNKEDNNKIINISIGSFFDYEKLRNYLMVHCQDLEVGGLRDKPGTQPDLYHSCYASTGLLLIDHIIKISKDGNKKVNYFKGLCIDVYHNIHINSIKKIRNFFCHD